MIPRLYHYTSAHGFDKIGMRGTLVPVPHPLLGVRATWFTDNPDAGRDDLGLTSVYIPYDRMAYRYRLIRARGSLVRWDEIRDDMPRAVVRDLESYSEPSSWWLSMGLSRVKLDRSYKQVAA